MDLVVKNGTVVTATDIFKGDVGVKDGKIVEVSTKIEKSASETINAEGLLVTPGMIDVHTHFQLPFMGTISADDFVTGSRAAACGGITTFIDFAIQTKGKTVFEALEARRKEADGNVFIDYSLHAGITDFTDETMAAIPKLIDMGIPSFKVFLIYAKEGWIADDGSLYALLESAREHGALVGVHAENPYIIDYNVARFLKEGKVTPPWHARSRPNFVEAEAIARAIFWTEQTRSRLYIFHMSSGEGAILVGQAKGRGVMVFSETCPQYLLLTDEVYEGPEGIYYPTSPPLRKQADNELLWKGIAMGAIQVVATDHCSFTKEQKDMGKDVFTKIPNGLPGVETLAPLMYSEGVAGGRIGLNQFVEILSSNPAKLFGLYPRKGTLAPGADADIVVFDPKKRVTLSHRNLHMNLDFSPFEGREVQGWPEYTISRGKVVWNDGRFVGEKGWGQFVPRIYLEKEWEKVGAKEQMVKT